MSERKVLALQNAAVSDTGEFSGHGAIFNNIDDGGDMIEPGFFTDTLDDFMREGFIAYGHDWSNPVAMPTSAGEDSLGLALGGQFHSTPRAQEARQITSERLAAGKSMGLSIGYEVADEALKDDGTRRLIKASRLFEVSLVMVPMNRLAGVSAVKGQPYVDHADQLITDLWALLARSKEVARPRKEGRILSSANRTRLGSFQEALAAVMADVEDLLASTDPDAEKAAIAKAVELEYLLMQARLSGHLI